MQDYITIKEASKLTGKSKITIRRFIKTVYKQANDLGNITDNNQSVIIDNVPVIKIEAREGKQTYFLQKDFLLKNIDNRGFTQDYIQDTNQNNPEDKQNTNQDNHQNNTQDPNQAIAQDYIQTLKDQLKEKDTQINQLLERTRESNLIINSLQNKILLLESPKKRGFFGWMLGKKKQES